MPHRELVAQDHDLEVLVGLGLVAKSEELKPSLEYYKEGEHHGPRIVPSTRLIDNGAQC